MSLSTFNADVEALRAELRKKEHDLLLAARYGKSLLEENERIKQDLENMREEHDNAMELLETQRRESQRSMIESRQTAEQHISEMEQQVADLKNKLTRERLTTSSLKEEHVRSMEQLQTENFLLRESLAKMNEELEGERSQHKVTELTKRLGKSEKKVQQLTLESAELQKQLEIVQDSNKTLSLDLSSLANSCDQLTSELVACRDEVEYWEKKYRDKNKELDTCSKDLDDSQELLNQLQIELDQQSSCTPKSARSGSRSASLYDELCSSRDSLGYMGLMHSEDLSSTCGSDLVERDDTSTTNGGLCSNDSSPNLLRSQGTEVVLPEKCSQNVTCGWEESDVFQCQRCQEMNKKLASNEEELKWVNEQLLLAVQQKFKLQQQIEAWQTDMTQVVEQQVQRKLIKGTFSSSSKRNSKSKSKHDPPQRQLSYHMIKDSLVC